MKFWFDKLLPKSSFDVSVENVRFCGEITKKSATLAELSGVLSGEFQHACDGCGESVVVKADEKLTLVLSNGIYKGVEGEEFCDAYEFLDGVIDIYEVAQSEIELLNGDYFYCNDCENKR